MAEPHGHEAPWLHFLLIGLFTGIVLYFTVLLKVSEAAYFSAVVFMVICIKHAEDVSPYVYAFNRTLDTVIGVAVAEIVNRLHLPRLRKKDTLFVSSIGDTILGPDRQLAPYSKVELNRLLDDGAMFTVATSETQATVRELLAGVELRWPVITMDGAALYDMKTMEYLETVPMSAEKARRLVDWAHGEGLPFFSNSVEENLLVIRYEELANPAMQQLFEQKRKSPYRNYVHSPADLDKDLLYLLILDRTGGRAAPGPWRRGRGGRTSTDEKQEKDPPIRLEPGGALPRPGGPGGLGCGEIQGLYGAPGRRAAVPGRAGEEQGTRHPVGSILGP